MSGGLLFTLTLLAALGSGLIGGVFFAFSAFVMKALATLKPAHGIAAMQSINGAVINPWFLAPFVGTAALCVPLIVASLGGWREYAATCRLIGGGLYLVGTILVTFVGNVPRNNALAAVAAGSAEGEARWARYVPGWTAWNTVRAVAALAAAAAFMIALVASAVAARR
jgi:uncharacterized membrane protein